MSDSKPTVLDVYDYIYVGQDKPSTHQKSLAILDMITKVLTAEDPVNQRFALYQSMKDNHQVTIAKVVDKEWTTDPVYRYVVTSSQIDVDNITYRRIFTFSIEASVDDRMLPILYLRAIPSIRIDGYHGYIPNSANNGWSK